MFTLGRALLAGATVFLLSATVPVHASSITFNFQFDGSGFGASLPLKDPIIGTGVVTLDSDPGLGSFALDSIGTFDMSFTVDGNAYTDADIKTPLDEVLLILTATSDGERLQFSSTNNFGSGPIGGSLDLVNALGKGLAFAPPIVGPDLNSYASNSGLPAGNYLGLAAVVVTPLPSALPLFAGGLGVVGLLMRRRKKPRASTPAH
jgi:hypothetical protein